MHGEKNYDTVRTRGGKKKTKKILLATVALEVKEIGLGSPNRNKDWPSLEGCGQPRCLICKKTKIK